MPWSMKRYENNVYEMLKSWGWDKEFERPGIYQIKIDGYPVYIGQSTNMLRRMA